MKNAIWITPVSINLQSKLVAKVTKVVGPKVPTCFNSSNIHGVRST